MEKTGIVWDLIEAHNNSIEEYINVVLPSKLRCEGYEVVDGRVTLDAWFAAQKLIAEEHFYDKACALCSALRAFGYDVKRDAQTDKLVWKGDLIV